mgnify:CR=1 FL=1
MLMLARRAPWGLLLALAGGCATGTAATPDDATDDPDVDASTDAPDVDAGPVNVELTVTPTTGGTITVAPAGTACGPNCSAYPRGTSVTITTDPDDSLTVTGWSGSSRRSCARRRRRRS